MAACGLAFIAGQAGESQTDDIATDFEAQVGQAHQNRVLALEAVGAHPDQVVKFTAYVTEH